MPTKEEILQKAKEALPRMEELAGSLMGGVAGVAIVDAIHHPEEALKKAKKMLPAVMGGLAGDNIVNHPGKIATGLENSLPYGAAGLVGGSVIHHIESGELQKPRCVGQKPVDPNNGRTQ